MPGCFDQSLRERGITGPRGVKLLHQHKAERVLGYIKELTPRNRGLWIEAEIDERISYAKDVALAIENQGGLNFSIGYRIKDVEAVYDDRGELIRWELHRLDLTEVSVVTMPMNEAAQMLGYGEKNVAHATLSQSIRQLREALS